MSSMASVDLVNSAQNSNGKAGSSCAQSVTWLKYLVQRDLNKIERKQSVGMDWVCHAELISLLEWK